MKFLIEYKQKLLNDRVFKTNIILAILAFIVFYSAPLYSTYAKNYTFVHTNFFIRHEILTKIFIVLILLCYLFI